MNKRLELVDVRTTECERAVCDLIGDAAPYSRVSVVLRGENAPSGDVDLVRDALRYMGFRCAVWSADENRHVPCR